jgi:hypothetical protein
MAERVRAWLDGVSQSEQGSRWNTANWWSSPGCWRGEKLREMVERKSHQTRQRERWDNSRSDTVYTQRELLSTSNPAAVSLGDQKYSAQDWSEYQGRNLWKATQQREGIVKLKHLLRLWTFEQLNLIKILRNIHIFRRGWGRLSQLPLPLILRSSNLPVGGHVNWGKTTWLWNVNLWRLF